MKKSKKIQRLKNNLVYFLVRSLVWVFNGIPRAAAGFFGAFFGYLAFLISSGDRRIAEKSLKMVYGEGLSVDQRKAIIRNLFINFGLNIADVLRFKKHFNRIRQLVDVEGLEHFENAYNRGKGIMAVTGHIGNFELMAAWFTSKGYKTAVIGREMYDKRLDKMLIDNRKSTGVATIDTKRSPRTILKLLKEGYALGVLIDIDSMRIRSEFIPVFGKLSWTPIGQSILGLKTGAAFVPMACVRNGRRYKIIIKEEISIERTDNFDNDVYNVTRKCTEALEEIINEHKDQWIWTQNRWNTRPPREKEPVEKTPLKVDKGAEN